MLWRHQPSIVSHTSLNVSFCVEHLVVFSFTQSSMHASAVPASELVCEAVHQHAVTTARSKRGPSTWELQRGSKRLRPRWRARRRTKPQSIMVRWHAGQLGDRALSCHACNSSQLACSEPSLRDCELSCSSLLPRAQSPVKASTCKRPTTGECASRPASAALPQLAECSRLSHSALIGFPSVGKSTLLSKVRSQLALSVLMLSTLCADHRHRLTGCCLRVRESAALTQVCIRSLMHRKL